MTNSTERSKGGRTVRRPPADDLDPAQVTTTQELLSLLQELFRRAGFNLRRLEAWAHQNGWSLPASTLSEVFNGKANFRRELLLGIVEACGLDDATVSKWDAAWARITERAAKADPTDSPTFQRQMAQRIDRESEINRQATTLRHREQQLRKALADAIKERDQLRKEVGRLRLEIAAERLRAEQLQRQYLASEVRVAELDTELRLVHDQRQRVESDCERLVAEKDDFADLEDLLHLHYDRAEYERHQREELESVKRSLQQRIIELEQLLGPHQAPRKAEPAPTIKVPTKPPPKFINRDIEVELELTDSDFIIGQHDVSVPHNWYCVGCDKGGAQPYATCPYCSEIITPNYAKTVLFNLPDEPCYGKRLRLPGKGNYDEPTMEPSDLYIRVKQRPSRWEQWRKK